MELEKIVEYYGNGNIIKEEYFINPETGLKEGLYKSYYGYNGNLSCECFYKNDKLEGTYKQYSDTGELFNECFYIDGKLEGKSKVYSYNGKLLLEYTYLNDELEGEYKVYLADGELNYIEYYSNGEEISKEIYDKLNKTIKCFYIINIRKYDKKSGLVYTEWSDIFLSDSIDLCIKYIESDYNDRDNEDSYSNDKSYIWYWVIVKKKLNDFADCGEVVKVFDNTMNETSECDILN